MRVASASSQSQGARASPDRFAQTIDALIAAERAIPLAHYMALCNADYYATRDPLGAAGDFVTAPEISQMFGELIGLWCADLWSRAGRPATHWVELGPGRGTLAADAVRAMARAGFARPVHLVETSPVLRQAQSARLPHARWHDAIDTLPADGALIVVANEFFDALPIRQYEATPHGWRERLVTHDGGVRVLRAEGAVPDPAPPLAAPGAVYEICPAGVAIMADLARRIVAQGGALLAIDYGHAGPAIGDTLQAVRAHARADPLADPGEVDMTAHVDFAALAAAARGAGARVAPLAEQGRFLSALGIAQRAAALARAAPARTEEIADAHRRLVEPGAMGRLFKVLAVAAPGWPAPAGVTPG